MSKFDPVEALEEILGKKDALNPFKAMEKTKGFLMVLCFTLGLAPLLIINFFKVVAPIAAIFGLIWLAKVIHSRTTKL